MTQTRLILFGASVATGVGFWLQQPYGVIALALAIAYTAFERSMAVIETHTLAKEDATRAVVALADRLTAVESAISKYELASSMQKFGR